jgi:hypothetical protein
MIKYLISDNNDIKVSLYLSNNHYISYKNNNNQVIIDTPNKVCSTDNIGSGKL